MWPGPRMLPLATQTVLLNDLAVALDVDVSSVVEHSTSTTDQHEQATTTVVVLLMALQVLGELVDPIREERDLDLGRPGVGSVQAVGRERRGLRRQVFGHEGSKSLSSRWA